MEEIPEVGIDAGQNSDSPKSPTKVPKILSQSSEASHHDCGSEKSNVPTKGPRGPFGSETIKGKTFDDIKSQIIQNELAQKLKSPSKTHDKTLVGRFQQLNGQVLDQTQQPSSSSESGLTSKFDLVEVIAKMSQDSYNILTDQTESFSLEQKLAYIKHQ